MSRRLSWLAPVAAVCSGCALWLVVAWPALADDGEAGPSTSGSGDPALQPGDGAIRAGSDGGLRADGAPGPPTGVHLKAGHVMVSAAAGKLRLTEVYALQVTEPLAPPDRILAVPLPAEAGQVKLLRGQEQWSLAASGRELTLSEALPEGQHTLALTYELSISGERVVVERFLPVAAEAFSVIWPDQAGYEIHAMGFEDQGVVTMGPRRMRLLERRNIPPGQRLVLVVTPGAEAPSQGEASGGGTQGGEAVDPLGQLKWLTLGLVVLALLAGMVLPRSLWWRSGS